MRAYFAELDRRSESGFDATAGISAEPHEVTPPAGLFLVAYLRGEPVGCGAVKHHPGEASEIKRMWVAEPARGLGIARRLLAELEKEAVASGASTAHLETNKTLVEAIALIGRPATSRCRRSTRSHSRTTGSRSGASPAEPDRPSAADPDNLRAVQLTFLGSGDAFAGGGRFQACLHLDDGAEPMLLDCGATALVAIRRAEIDPNSIGFVALSHLHGDHFAGLPWLILDGQFAGRTKPLRIAGPAGVRERVQRTFEALYPGAATVDRAFETNFVELTERIPLDFGPARVTPFEVRHSSGAPSYALRVEYGGKLIAYSGDTEWTDALIEVADGVDLFVCECNFFDLKAPGHLNYVTLAENRPRLNCSRLVITHMSEGMLARADEVEFEMAADGAAISL